jgi:hypothetical protein
MTLLARLREQARRCRAYGSPLTADLLDGAAGDLAAGGPTAALLRPLAAQPGSVPGLQLAGALHRLVLARRAPELALHYPSVGGTPGDVWPVARRVVAEHLDALRPEVARPVQTNEVGRSAALLGGLLRTAADTGLPVRLLEVGASAGLNLRVDAFAHDVADGVVLGDPGSPVRLTRAWSGRPPPYDAPLTVVERRGCDLRPLDPASAEDRLALTSYVWADQPERFERLRAALAVAQRRPVEVEASTASGFLARELAAPCPGVVTVVWQSLLAQYLSARERRALDDVLAAAGARAQVRAPLAHLTLEPERGPGGDLGFRVELTTWPGGRRRRIATCRGHGPPVTWH